VEEAAGKRAGRRKFGNLLVQTLWVGALLFLISFVIRVVANTLVGHATNGPGEPATLVDGDGFAALALNAVLSGVLLPAAIETPFVVYPVRRVDREQTSIALWIVITIIFGLAWLLHGASWGALGQATAFAFLAYASWGWSRRSGRLAYVLAIAAHAIWNGIATALYLATRAPIHGG
jgi:hypothetical protein